MPRQIPEGYRQSISSLFSEDVDLIFVTLYNEFLISPITVVNDTVDFRWGGVDWIGFPFDIMLLTDDDSPPKATVAFQNVDTIIGNTIAGIVGACRMRFQLMCSADFDLEQRPRVPWPSTSPAVIYDARALWLTNCKVDAMT